MYVHTYVHTHMYVCMHTTLVLVCMKDFYCTKLYNYVHACMYMYISRCYVYIRVCTYVRGSLITGYAAVDGCLLAGIDNDEGQRYGRVLHWSTRLSQPGSVSPHQVFEGKNLHVCIKALYCVLTTVEHLIHNIMFVHTYTHNVTHAALEICNS